MSYIPASTHVSDIIKLRERERKHKNDSTWKGVEIISHLQKLRAYMIK